MYKYLCCIMKLHIFIINRERRMNLVMMMTIKRRMTMRVRRRMTSEKYIMVILLFFGVVGVCKRSLGDDHGHPLWLSSYVSRWSYQGQLLVLSLTIAYLLSYEVISGFIPCALFQILMLHRFFFHNPLSWN